MNKSESKYFHTACLMDEALLALLENKDYAYITVKEICEKAGVNRSTFYLHYETVDDLLKESLSFMLSKFNKKYDGNSQIKTDSDSLNDLFLITPEYIIPYLEFLSENRHIFMTVVEKPAVFGVMKHFDEIYSRVFDPILERFGVEPCERKYVLAYHMSGMHAIMIEWLKGGCKEPMQYIANLLIKYTLPYKDPPGHGSYVRKHPDENRKRQC
ncbi:MAG: TetR/AcrR family transcriptional regulator [Eubacteriales bacterium]|nr:TetR/AcrR family transcriptional regulator [Eubacteriales bacterium]